jgi:tRNA pseudouridine55 synthase
LNSSSAFSGFLLCNKPEGLTSFSALSRIKKALGTKKVGHAGTLDKFASGLLIVLVGPYTRLVQWFTGADKEYRAIFYFGKETNTLDPEGQICAEGPLPKEENLVRVLDAFRGEILQAPPAYSAVHIGGKRAYQMALAGDVPQMIKRPVYIHELELVSYTPPFAEFRIVCSKGTYIRSLARDIGLACGSRAYLSALQRTRVANFSVDEAITIPIELNEESSEIIKGYLQTPDKTIMNRLGLPIVQIDADIGLHIQNGRPLPFVGFENILKQLADGYTAVCGPDEIVLSIIERHNDTYSYAWVHPRRELL